MPTTPSPYHYNYARYHKVPARVKRSGSGCAVLALMTLITPVLAISAVVVRLI